MLCRRQKEKKKEKQKQGLLVNMIYVICVLVYAAVMETVVTIIESHVLCFMSCEIMLMGVTKHAVSFFL